MSIWTPVLVQTLLVKWEPTNSKDKNEVALYLEDVVLGHCPSQHRAMIFATGC